MSQRISANFDRKLTESEFSELKKRFGEASVVSPCRKYFYGNNVGNVAIGTFHGHVKYTVYYALKAMGLNAQIMEDNGGRRLGKGQRHNR